MSAAILGAIGWVYRQGRADDRERDNALAEQSRALAVLVASQPELQTWRGVTDRSIGQLREQTSVLSAVLERHEAWHERNDPVHRRRD